LIYGIEKKIPIAAFIKDEKTVCVVFDHFIQEKQGNFKLKKMLEKEFLKEHESFESSTSEG
jgi:predicted AlkP superfamily phosphohydrolase/phosphomutase